MRETEEKYTIRIDNLEKKNQELTSQIEIINNKFKNYTDQLCRENEELKIKMKSYELL